MSPLLPVTFITCRGGARARRASVDGGLSEDAVGGVEFGGGIYTGSSATLTSAITIASNSAIGGAGVDSFTTPTNTAGNGATDWAEAGGAAIGGALTVAGGSALAQNTILSANNSGGAADIYGSLLNQAAVGKDFGDYLA